MSFEALNWVARQKFRSTAGKCIALVMANYADREGTTYAGQETIADEAECTARTVRWWLAEWEKPERGAIITRQERRRPDGYRTSDFITLHLDRTFIPAAAPGFKGETSPEVASGDNAGISPEAISAEVGISPEADADLTGNGFRAINRTIQEKPSARGAARGVREALVTLLDEATAERLVAHLKVMGTDLSPLGAEQLARRLDTWPDPVQAAERMIERRWKSFDRRWMASSQSRPSPATKQVQGTPVVDPKVRVFKGTDLFKELEAMSVSSGKVLVALPVDSKGRLVFLARRNRGSSGKARRQGEAPHRRGGSVVSANVDPPQTAAGLRVARERPRPRRSGSRHRHARLARCRRQRPGARDFRPETTGRHLAGGNSCQPRHAAAGPSRARGRRRFAVRRKPFAGPPGPKTYSGAAERNWTPV